MTSRTTLLACASALALLFGAGGAGAAGNTSPAKAAPKGAAAPKTPPAGPEAAAFAGPHRSVMAGASAAARRTSRRLTAPCIIDVSLVAGCMTSPSIQNVKRHP